jgi:ATP-binding cassette subfamily C protein CydCD
VLGYLTWVDWQAGVLLMVMMPLVPLFMVLVGVTTKRRVERQYALIARISGHFLDLMRGLTTLTVYGQTSRQQRTMRRANEEYRRHTMGALRIAFLSALVLDLAAALSVAVVAVDVGLRLDAGHVSFASALLVLFLAPEVFGPLRQFGAQYHAQAEGRTAAEAALAIIDEAGSESLPASAVGVARAVADGSVGLDSVSVRHAGQSANALEHVTLMVQPGEIVALTGPSGAGKSTVLAVLRGSCAPSSGQILVGTGGELVALDELDRTAWRAGVAWLPQRPHPTSAFVADEVRLGDPTASDERVAVMCAQAHAPAPVVGLGVAGRRVAAGQRRRIALARVLLRIRAIEERGGVPIVLLDEPSEDLDALTEQVVAEVIDRLRGRCTVLIATHSDALVGVADRRVLLHDGRVVDVRTQRPQRVGRRPVAGFGTFADEHRPAATRPEPSDDRPDRLRRWSVRDLIRIAGLRRRLALAGLLASGAGVAGLGLTATSTWLISRAAQHPNVQALSIAVVGVRAFAIGRALLRYADRLQTHDVALRLMSNLRNRIFAALGRRAADATSLAAPDRGDALRRLVGDTDGVQDLVVRGIAPAIGAVATAGATVTLAAAVLPDAGVVLLLGLLIGGIVLPAVARRLAGDGTDAASRAGGRDADVSRLVDGFAELEAYGAVAARLQGIESADAQIARLRQRPDRIAATATAFTGCLEALTVAAVLVLGARAVAAGRLSEVVLAVLVACVLVAFEAITPLPAAAVTACRARAAVARVVELIDAPAPDAGASDPVGLPPASMGLSARELTVRPAVGLDPVLVDARLRLAARGSLALVGPSGCGKTSVLRAILGLAPREGTLEIVPEIGDVTPLEEIPRPQLPAVVAGSLQGDHVFDASLRDNLRLVRPEATDAELDDVARRAGLLEVVRARPGGWASGAGPDGARLSGGQRQRLLLARALLADPAILLLDEPTAHLDAETEAAVLTDVLRATSGRTVVLCTHRRPTMRYADVVVDIGAPGAGSEQPQETDVVEGAS